MITNDKFLNEYSRLAKIADSWLENVLPSVFESKRLIEASSYSLLSPGKRLRPVLALAAAEMLKVEISRIRPFAAALECIHAFSLIHDDLPAMDNDSLRRGLPTCHVRFDEATALLAGDYLMGRAFLCISEAEELTASEARDLLKLLTQAVLTLCEGQMLDLQASGKAGGLAGLEDQDALASLEVRHRKKTGALINCAILGPGYLVQNSPSLDLREHLEAYADTLGLLFQVTDDILDVCSTTAQIGKPAKSDEQEGTPTYVSVYGLAKAKRIAKQLEEQAQKALEPFGAGADFFRQLARYIEQREK